MSRIVAASAVKAMTMQYHAGGSAVQDQDSARATNRAPMHTTKMNGRFTAGNGQLCAKSIDCNGVGLRRSLTAEAVIRCHG